MTVQSRNDYLQPSEKFLNEVDFKLILFKLFENKWLILLITGIAVLIGILHTFNTAPKYLSSALIQVDSQLGTANNMQQLLGNMGMTLSPLEKASPAEIEIALIKSRFILNSVVQKLKLNISVDATPL
jgi:tyrosine-protein kinase Etk/Wzc